MTDSLKFESRTGKLSCKPDELFSFITDIRNFEQFIPAGSLNNWESSRDKCSFQVPSLGTVNVRITDQTPFSVVVYSGDVLKKNDFNLVVHISENEKRMAEVRVTVTANLNPVLRMMATGPIKTFLEKLISEMEKFEKWNSTSTGR
jgi:carbon monoxide dehydrogenase subunit G